jgi:Ni/Co efflux regulator RcnB
MNIKIWGMLGGLMILGVALPAQAENRWSNYQGVERTRYSAPPIYSHQHYPQHSYPQNYGTYPYPITRPYPAHPRPSAYPTLQNGVTIHYQAPTTITQNSQSYRWVNGDPNTAQIESSSGVLITDWHRLGLPAPPTGTYWIYEQGRYVLVPHRELAPSLH